MSLLIILADLLTTTEASSEDDLRSSQSETSQCGPNLPASHLIKKMCMSGTPRDRIPIHDYDIAMC